MHRETMITTREPSRIQEALGMGGTVPAFIAPAEETALVILDPNCRIRLANVAFARLLHQPTDKLRELSLWEIVPEEDQSAVEAIVQQARTAAGTGLPLNCRLVDGAGLLQNFSGSLAWISVPQGEQAFVLQIRPGSQQTPKRCDWQALFESTPGLALIFAADGSLLYHNIGYASYFDGPPQTARELMLLSHSKDRAKIIRSVRLLENGHEVRNAEGRWRRPDGSFAWLSWSARLVSQAGVYYVLGHDITEERTVNEQTWQRKLLFRQLADAMPQIVWTTDGDGQVDYVNGHWQTYTGEESLGNTTTSPMEHVPPSDLEGVRSAWVRSLHSGRPFEMAVRLRRALDATYRWHLARAVCVRDEQRITRWLGTATDIHEHRIIEEQLAAAQRMARLGSWRYDVTTDRMTWSRELFEIFGIDPATAKLSQENLSLLLGTAEHLTSFESSLTQFERQQVIERPDGTILDCHFHAIIERSEDGSVARIVGTVQDLTQLREKDRILARQADLLNQTLDAIILRDFDDRVEFWNKGAERILGWTSEEVAGRNIYEIVARDPDEQERAKRKLLEHGVWSGEVKCRSKSGAEVILSCRWSLVRDSQDRAVSILAVCTDITAHRELESQFLRAQRVESIGTLASGVAHDLNNILAPILMAAPMLKEDLAKETRFSLAELIEASARRGAGIVRQVLTFARGEEGERILLQPRHLLLELGKIASGTFPKNIQVTTEVQADLWKIKGDPTHLHQVLLNLSLNARDAMPAGGTLSLRAHNFVVDESYASMSFDAAPGPHVVLEVEDTGTGIQQGALQKIFDPFFTTKEVGQGTGLGLSTVRGLVRAHRGFIETTSQLGVGTCFRIFLPATADSAGVDDASSEQIEITGTNELILLVDDESTLLNVCSALLRKCGFRVTTAADGPEAIAYLALHLGEVRVVITDLMMPLMDGLALIHAIRRMSPEVAIIASSGDSEAEMRVKDAGALAGTVFLSKPYDRNRLLFAVGSALSAVRPRNGP